MDKIKKVLNKLSLKEKEKIKGILNKIAKGNFNNLDIKKLKNREDIFRVRRGRIRIVYILKKDNIKILLVEKRSDNTYNF